MRHRKNYNHRRLMFWAAEQRSKAMKITVKLKTGVRQEEAEMLIKASGSAFPEADIDVIYCDDPAMSVVLMEKPERNQIADPVQHESKRNEFNPHARPDGGVYGRD